MPTIEIGLDQRRPINAAHAEYTRQTRDIEMIVEGPPLFSGSTQSGLTLIVSQGFAAFLEARGIVFRPA